MENTPSKPIAHPTPTTLPFWQGLRERKIFIQYSPSTGQWVFYPRVLAPRTLAADLEWREISGRGTLYTFTVARYPTSPAWKDKIPPIVGGSSAR
jgi:uncharacterized OB-fold protein